MISGNGRYRTIYIPRDNVTHIGYVRKLTQGRWSIFLVFALFFFPSLASVLSYLSHSLQCACNLTFRLIIRCTCSGFWALLLCNAVARIAHTISNAYICDILRGKSIGTLSVPGITLALDTRMTHCFSGIPPPLKWVYSHIHV